MMGMGLIGALGGLGEGIASIADQNIKADNEIRVRKELALVDEQREARRLALAQKYKIEDEQRGIANRQKLLDTEGTPENIANQAGKLKLAQTKDTIAEQDVIAKGEGKFADGSEVFTTPEGEVYRLDKDGNAVGGWAGKDEFEKERMGLTGRAKLAETEAQTKEREANARMRDAVAGNGGVRGGGAGGGLAGAKWDRTKFDKFIKDNETLYTSTDSISGKAVKNANVESAFRAAAQRNPEGAVAFFNDLRSAAEKQATDKNGVVDDDKANKIYAQSATAAYRRLSGGQQAAPAAGRDSGTQAGPAAGKAGGAKKEVPEAQSEVPSSGKKALIGSKGMSDLRQKIEEAKSRVAYLKDNDSRPQDVVAAEKELARLEKALQSSAANEYTDQYLANE